MPRGNGTGPMGQGPMTGRGAGFCGGSARAGFWNGRGRGGGFGGGSGGGRRHRNRLFSTGLTGSQEGTLLMEDERDLPLLKIQADELERDLRDIRLKIEKMERK